MSCYTIKGGFAHPGRRSNWNRHAMPNTRPMVCMALLVNLLMAGSVFADEMQAEPQGNRETRAAHAQDDLFDLSDEMTTLLYEKMERRPQPALTDLSEKMTAAMNDETDRQYQQIADQVEQARLLDVQARNMLTAVAVEVDSDPDAPCWQ